MNNQISLISQKFTSLLDSINDKLSSYRLVLYFLILLVGWAVAGSFFGQVPYTWHEILISTVWLVGVCWLVNKAISKFLDIPANKESGLITGLILALILSPPKGSAGFAILAAAGAAAIASKYIITYRKSHLFNPAAIGAFTAGEIFHKYPSWWVGTKFMAPLVVIGGLLILRKMKRFSMVGVFLATFILYLIYGTSAGSDLHFLWLEIISTQLLFFAVIMLTEPLTSPTTAQKYIPYAVIVGIFYTASKLKLAPEEALLVGNLFTFTFARSRRYQLRFIRSIKEAEGVYSYLFTIPKKFKFKPGQYMQWTIAHNKTDARGNRRYLTIASSPTEPGLMFTIKQTPSKQSAFKAQLDKLKAGDNMLAGHLEGDFTLPKDQSKKIALLAGGIGVTPFRSMVKYLIDSKQQRDVALIYSTNSPDEIAFEKLFNSAEGSGFYASYVTRGRIDELKIKQLLPDYRQRQFYVSGPYGFVNAVDTALLRLGVPSSEIVTDYFPGYS